MAKSMYLCQGPSRQTEEIIKMSSTCTNMENVIHHDSGKVPWASSDAPCEQVVCRPTGPMVPGRFQSSKKKTVPRPWLYKCSILSCNGFSTNNPITLANHLATHGSSAVTYDLEFPGVPASSSPPPAAGTNIISTATGGHRVASPQLPIQDSSIRVKTPMFR